MHLLPLRLPPFWALALWRLAQVSRQIRVQRRVFTERHLRRSTRVSDDRSGSPVLVLPGDLDLADSCGRVVRPVIPGMGAPVRGFQSTPKGSQMAAETFGGRFVTPGTAHDFGSLVGPLSGFTRSIHADTLSTRPEPRIYSSGREPRSPSGSRPEERGHFAEVTASSSTQLRQSPLPATPGRIGFPHQHRSARSGSSSPSWSERPRSKDSSESWSSPSRSG